MKRKPPSGWHCTAGKFRWVQHISVVKRQRDRYISMRMEKLVPGCLLRFPSILMARCSLKASCHNTSGEKRAQQESILSSHRHAIREWSSRPKHNTGRTMHSDHPDKTDHFNATRTVSPNATCLYSTDVVLRPFLVIFFVLAKQKRKKRNSRQIAEGGRTCQHRNRR